MVIVGVLASIAVPRLLGAVTRARAAAALSDVRVAQRAVVDYFVHHDAWPPPSDVGEVPAGLQPFLPDGFTFSRGDVRLTYRIVGTGVSAEAEDSVSVSLRVADNPALREALARLLGQDGASGDAGSYGGVTVMLDGQDVIRKAGL